MFFVVSVVFSAPILIQKENRLGGVLGSVIRVGRKAVQTTIKY